jgi:hypothetical protein
MNVADQSPRDSFSVDSLDKVGVYCVACWQWQQRTRCAGSTLGPNLKLMFHVQESGEPYRWNTVDTSMLRRSGIAGLHV